MSIRFIVLKSTVKSMLMKLVRVGSMRRIPGFGSSIAYCSCFYLGASKRDDEQCKASPNGYSRVIIVPNVDSALNPSALEQIRDPELLQYTCCVACQQDAGCI